MADIFPVDVTSQAVAELSRPADDRYTPSVDELVRQAGAAKHLADMAARRGRSPESYTKSGEQMTQQHWLLDLDADSAYTIPGAVYGSYLQLGGQS